MNKKGDLNKPKSLTVLGSTGSIGKSTLDVVARHPDKYQIFALTANQQDELLFEQCNQFKPRYAVMLDEQASQRLRHRIISAGLKTEVLSGVEGLEQVSAAPLLLFYALLYVAVAKSRRIKPYTQ